MLELFIDYIFFLVKSLTIVISIIIVVASILALSTKQKQALKEGKVEITDLSEKIKEQIKSIKEIIYDKKELKNFLKQEKKATKSDKNNKKPKLFILEFTGDIKASAVTSLQHSLNSILPIINKNQDEVLVKLESPGGMVHTYGLAASQLDRIKQHGVKLTVAVDKVAASGGYMMACVADKIISAPFAIIGSIGVIGQVPNFHKVLEKHNIDFEQHTAGEFKRTLTIFGENDDKARDKFKEELEITHDLFKKYITNRRNNLDINSVATGEHWYGQVALEKNLVDKIATSDDVILEYYKTHDLYEVKYQHKKSASEKLSNLTYEIISAIKNSIIANNKI